MPRLRVVDSSPGVLPAELGDVGSPVWDSRASAERFMVRHGLRGDLGSLPDTAEYRHWFVASLWAVEHGLTRVLPGGHVVADRARMREAGIRDGYAARVRARVLLSAAATD